jgi:hypothetical protein
MSFFLEIAIAAMIWLVPVVAFGVTVVAIIMALFR